MKCDRKRITIHSIVSSSTQFIIQWVQKCVHVLHRLYNTHVLFVNTSVVCLRCCRHRRWYYFKKLCDNCVIRFFGDEWFNFVRSFYSIFVVKWIPRLLHLSTVKLHNSWYFKVEGKKPIPFFFSLNNKLSRAISYEECRECKQLIARLKRADSPVKLSNWKRVVDDLIRSQSIQNCVYLKMKFKQWIQTGDWNLRRNWNTHQKESLVS